MRDRRQQAAAENQLHGEEGAGPISRIVRRGLRISLAEGPDMVRPRIMALATQAGARFLERVFRRRKSLRALLGRASQSSPWPKDDMEKAAFKSESSVSPLRATPPPCTGAPCLF